MHMERYILPEILNYHTLEVYEQHGGYSALKKRLA
jgi:hypothetical protein